MSNGFDPAADGWERANTWGFVESLGTLWSRHENGALAFGLVAEEKHLDASGAVDNRAVMAFADHAIGSAGVEALGTSQVTIQLETQFTGSAYLGDFIEGRGAVVSVLDSMVFLRGQIAVGSRIIATCAGIWKAVRPL